MTLIVFIFGLIFGSFLSMVFARLESAGVGLEPPRRSKRRRPDTSPLTGRSRCDHCRKEIAWYDNIPLVSFIWLRGKCRHCQQMISHYHPLLELSSALWLTAAFLLYGLTLQFGGAATFGLVMLLLFAYDSKHQIIPDVVVFPSVGLAVVLIAAQTVLNQVDGTVQLLLFSTDPLKYLAGGVVGGGFFLILSLVSGGKWIGGGDIKLGLLLGLLLGWPYVLVGLVVAYLIGSLYAVALLATRHAHLGSSLAFGPMLVMGYFIAACYGRELIGWYQGWFL